MAGCGCNGDGTVISGTLLRNDSVPISKIQWQTGATLPASGNWPVTKDMLIKYVADNPGGTVVSSNQALLIDAYGGGVGKTGAENRAALVNAIADAETLGIPVIQYGYGTYIQDPHDLIGIENVTIKGFGYGTKIQMSTTLGDAIFKLAGCTNVIIRDLRIDCEDSTATGAGGIWVSGIRNRVENVWVDNGDGFSICVIGSYSNGVTFVPTPTYDNVVYNCVITGQLRYHTIVAKAALLVAEAAERTHCEKILLIDNFLAGGETGDYVGNDHGLHTTFRDIICIKTSEGLADGAGMHLEGGEDYDNMYVTVENLTVRNMTIGVSISEKSRAIFRGENTIVGCKNGIRNYADYTGVFENFNFIGCGLGLESSDIEGVVNNITSGIYRNLRFSETLSRCEFVNYNGNDANSVALQSRLESCHFTKYCRLSYTNVGSYFVALDGCSFTNTRLDWYNNLGLRVDISGCFFNNSTISGAVVGYAAIGGQTRFYTTNAGLTFISLVTGTYNTRISNTLFEGGDKIGDNVTLGLGIIEINMATPTPKFDGNGGTITGNVTINTPGGTTSALTLEDDAISKTVGGNFFFGGSGLTAQNGLIGPGSTSASGPNAKAAFEVRSKCKRVSVAANDYF